MSFSQGLSVHRPPCKPWIQRGRNSRLRATKEERVEFSSPAGDRLVGTLLCPSEEARAKPTALLAHGYMSGRNSELLVRLATMLARTCGLASLRFDFSGNGDSGGRFRYGHYRSEAAELAAARALLAAQGRQVVAAIGHSKGGTDVVMYAGTYDDVPYVVNIAGRFDVSEGVERRLGSAVLTQLREQGQVDLQGRGPNGPFTWTLTAEDLHDRLSTDVAAACAAIRATRVLTVHGSADADVPVTQAARFAGAIAPGLHELVVVEGGDHCFTDGAAMYELAASVAAFLAPAAAATPMR